MLVFFIIIISVLILLVYVLKKYNETIKHNQIEEVDSYVAKILNTNSLNQISTHINLKYDEIAFLECNSSLSETRNVRYYQSGHTGIKVARRLYFGQTTGKSVSLEELKFIDNGTLTLTNKRLVFNGASNTRNTQIEKLIAVNSLRTSIAVASESSKKSMIFTVPNPLIWELTVKILLSVHNPLKLTKYEIESITGRNIIIPEKEYATQEDTVLIESIPSKNPYTRPSNEYLGSYHSRIQANYRAKRESLYGKFKNGYDFLTIVENNNKDIWLGTATNAHLYLRNNYLAYIVLNTESLSFRARLNQQIHSGTIDNSKEMFSNNFINLILSFEGFNKGWAVREGEFYTFTKATPNEFFISLLEYISNLKLN